MCIRDRGDDLPKGFLFFEVNDVNPLNALTVSYTHLHADLDSRNSS